VSVNVKVWWDNRHTLNQKMAQGLRDELAQMLARTEELILAQPHIRGPMGQARQDEINQQTLKEFRERIAEMDEILTKFSK
jgi:hypothetical protein